MTTFTIKAYNSVAGNTVRSTVEAADFDEAAHLASDMYRGKPEFRLWTVIIMGPLGSKRADLLDGWYPGLWDLKLKRAGRK